MTESKRERYIRILSGLDGAEISAEACKELVELLKEPKIGYWTRVHGYVTPGGDPVWACSECGKGLHVYGIEHGSYGADISDGQWVACPNCGATMEGEK